MLQWGGAYTKVLATLALIAQNQNGKDLPWNQLKRCWLHNRTPRSPSCSSTCGKILEHSKRQITAFREHIGISICVFKIGVTANPAQRFMDYLHKNFTEMWVVYRGPDLGLVHMLEAALIDMFHQVSGCRNAARSGGEGGLNRKEHLGPPFYVYITGGRADQPKRVG